MSKTRLVLASSALALLVHVQLVHAQVSGPSIDVGALQSQAEAIQSTAGAVVKILFDFIPVISGLILIGWALLRRDIAAMTHSIWFYFLVSAIVIWALVAIGSVVSPEFGRIAERIGISAKPFWLP